MERSSGRNLSPFAASAARTLEALPLLVSGDEAIRILMQLPPQQKIWLALEHVGLPSSATNASAIATGVTTMLKNEPAPSTLHRFRQMAEQQSQKSPRAPRPQQQQQQPAPASSQFSSFQRTGTAEYIDATRDDEEEEDIYEQHQQQQQQHHQHKQQHYVGAISPPRPLVRSAMGPREHDKSAHLYENEQAEEDGMVIPVREPWNASPKPTRDHRDCFPRVGDEPEQQQQQDDIGLIDRDLVSRVIRSPYRERNNNNVDGSSSSSAVKVFRYDPRAFEGNTKGNNEIVQTPPSSSRLSPRRTPQQHQQQQQSGGILMDRLRETVQQGNHQQHRRSDFHHDPHADNFHDEQQQQHQQQPREPSQQSNNNTFFASIPQRNLGQHRTAVHSVEQQPAVAVHMNRSLILRRDSALKRNSSASSSGAAGGVSPYRNRGYKHVKATVHRPPQGKDVVAPTRPGGTGAFFLSTAQHFPAVSPSRDHHGSSGGGGDGFYGGTSPIREDRRGRRGIAWVV